MFTHEEDAQVHHDIHSRIRIPQGERQPHCRPFHRGIRPTERSPRAQIRVLRAKVLETMLYACVTWSPRAFHYDTLRRAHHSFLARCIGWQKNNRADHPISYLDTLIKTVRESIESTSRKKRILFAGFVAPIEDETIEVRDV